MIYSDWHFCHSLQMNPHETMEYLDVLFILQQNSLCLRDRMIALDKLASMDSLRQAYAVPELVNLLFSAEAKAACETEENEDIVSRFRLVAKQILHSLLSGGGKDNATQLHMIVGKLDSKNDDDVLADLRSISDRKWREARDRFYLETQEHVPELILLGLLCQLSREQTDKVQEIVSGNLKRLFHSARNGCFGLLPQRLALEIDIRCDTDRDKIEANFPEDWLSLPEFMEIFARSRLYASAERTPFETIQDELTSLTLFQQWNRTGLDNNTPAWFVDIKHSKKVLCAVLWQSILWELAWEADPERCLMLANNYWGPPNYSTQLNHHSQTLPAVVKVNWITQKVLDEFPAVYHKDPMRTFHQSVCTPWQYCAVSGGITDTKPFQSVPAMRRNSCALRAFAASAMLRRIFTDYPSPCRDKETKKVRNHNILRLILNLGYALESSGPREERAASRASYTWSQALRGLGCYAYLCITALGVGDINRDLAVCLSQDVLKHSAKDVNNWQLKALYDYQGLLVCARWADKAQSLYTVSRTGISGSPWEQKVGTLPFTCIDGICKSLSSKTSGQLHEDRSVLRLLCQNGDYAFPETGTPPYWYDRCMDGLYKGDRITIYDLLQAPVPPPEVWTTVSPVLSQLREQEGSWISADAWEVILTLRLQAALETAGDRDAGEWIPWFNEWHETLSSGGNIHDNPVLFYALIRLLKCQPHVTRNLDMDKNPLDIIPELIVQLVDVFTEGERAYFQHELGCSLAQASPAFGAECLHRACAEHIIALDRQAEQLPYATDLKYYFLKQILFWPPEKTEHVLTNVRRHLINYYQQRCVNSQRNNYHVQGTNGGQRLDPLLDRYLHRRNGQLFAAHQRLEPRDAINSLTSRTHITGMERRILGIVTDKQPCHNGSRYQLRLGEITRTVNSMANFKLGDLAVLDQTANPPRLFTPIWQWKDGGDVLRVQINQLSVSRISLRDAGTHAPMRDYLRDFIWDTLRRQTENQRVQVNLADMVNDKMEERLSEALDLWTPNTFAYENGVYSHPLPEMPCEVVYNEELKSYVPVERSFFRLLLDHFYGKAETSMCLYYISWQRANGVRSVLFSAMPGFNYRLCEEDWTEDSFTVLSKELFHSDQNYGTAVTVRLAEKDGFPLLTLEDNAFDFHNRDWAKLFRANEAFCAEEEGGTYWVTKVLSALSEIDDDEEELPNHDSLSMVKIQVTGRFGMDHRENCGLADNGWNRLQQRKKTVQAVQYRNYTFSDTCTKDAALICRLTSLRPGDVFEMENYKALDDRYPGYCWTRMKGTWVSMLCALESITLADREPVAPGLLADRKCVVENVFPLSFREETSRIEAAELIPNDKLPESLRELPEDVQKVWGVVVTVPGQSRELRETDNLNFKVSVCTDGSTVEILDLPGSAFGRKPKSLGCKVFFRREKNGWRATAFQQTVYVRALWRVDIHDASVPLIQNGYSLGTTRIGRDYHFYYVMQDPSQPVLHAWPERFAPEGERELSGTRSGYVQLKENRHSDWEVFQYAKNTRIALLVGNNGCRRWGEVITDYFPKEGNGRAFVRIYEVNGLREYFQEIIRKTGKDNLKQMPFYDVRTIFESRKQEEQPAKKQKIQDNIAWYQQWYQGMERHLQGTLYVPANEGKGRTSISKPEDGEAFQLSDCQLPEQIHPDATGEWLSRIPFRKSDERQLWVRHRYPNGSRIRARMVEEDGHWAASCLTAEPFELGEDLAAEFQANPDELIDQENLYLSFAGVEQNEYLRFEWGYGYTFLAARNCIVDMDFHPNDAELFFGDRIRKFYISYWEKEGKWVLRLPPDAIKHRIVYYLWRDAGLGIVQMLRVQINQEKNKIKLLEVSRAEYRVDVSGSLMGNAWFFDDLYFGQLDSQSRTRLLEETKVEYPDKPVVERQIFVLLDCSASADRKRPPQFQYISLKHPEDLELIAGKIVCLAAGNIEKTARQNRAKQSNDFRLKFYLDTELPSNEGGNSNQASLVVNVNRRKFSLDESKLRVLYTQQKETAFYGSRMLVRLEKTDYLHFRDGRVEWSGFVRGICIREQSSLREWVSSKRDCLVTLGNIPSEHLANPDGWMIQVEVAPGITSEIPFQDVEGKDYKNGATALLEMVDDTLKAYVVLPSDEDYIPQKGRVVELLIMDGAANNYHAVPDRAVLEPEGDSGKHFTVAGFPQLVFRNQKLLERLICRPWPRLAIISVDGGLSSEELTKDGGAARIECTSPSENPSLCFLGAPEGTERTVEKRWSQLSYMDAGSSAIYRSLKEGTWHYHDRTYGVYDSTQDRLNIYQLPSGVDSRKFLVFPNQAGNLRIPQNHFSDMGFPIRELTENGVPNKKHTYAIAGADERSIWIEAFPGRLLEIPKRFLFVGGCITNLKRFPNSVLAPGDMLTLKEGESYKGGLRTLTVTEFHYGLRASLEWDKSSPQQGGKLWHPVRRAVLPVREVLEDGVVLGSTQWNLTYPLPATEVSDYQEGGTAVLDSWNQLSPGGQLCPGDVGMLYFDPKTRRLTLYGHSELSAKPSKKNSDWGSADWLGKLLSDSDPYIHRKLFEAIGENEMLPIVCKSITQYKEAWLTRVQEDFPEDSMLYGICLGQLEDERCLETAGLSAPVVLVRAGKSLLYIDRQQLLPGLSDKQYAGVVRVMYGRGIWLYRKDGTWHCGMEDSPLETDRSQVEIQLLDKVPEARGFLTLSCQSMELMWLPYENAGLMGEYLGTDRTTETVWEALEASAHFANQMKPISATGSNVRRARLLENRSVSLVNVNRTKHDSEILAVGTKLRATPLVPLDQQKKQVMFRYIAEVYPQGELILLYTENENEVRLGRPIAVEVSKRSQSVVQVVLDGMRRERQALTSELHQAYANSHDACGIYHETPDVRKILHLDRQNAYLQCSRQAAADAGKRKAVNTSYCREQCALYGSGAPLVYLYSYLTAFSSPIASLYTQKSNLPANDWYEKNWWWHVYSYLRYWMESDGRLLLLYFCGHPLDKPIVTHPVIDAVPAITAALLLYQIWLKGGEKDGDLLYSDAGKLSVHMLRMMGLAGEISVHQEVLLKYWFAQERSSGLWTRLNHITIGGERTCGSDQCDNPREDGYNGTLSSVQLYRLVTQCEHILHLDMDAAKENVDIQRRISVAQSLLYSVGRLKNFAAYEQVLENLSEKDTPLITWTLAKLGRTLTPRSVDEIAADHLTEPVVKLLKSLWKGCLKERWMPQLLLNYPTPLKSTDEIDSRFKKCLKRFTIESEVI